MQSRFRSDNWPLLLFPLLSCNVIIWFRAGLPLGWGDSGFYYSFLHPTYLLRSYQFTWDTNGITGSPAPQHIALIPITAMFALFKVLGIPLFARQMVAFWLIELLAMSSAFILIRRLIIGQRDYVLTALFASVLYVFSPLIMINFWYVGNLSIGTIMALPIFLLAADLSLQYSTLLSVLIAAGALLLCSAVFENPAYMLPVIGATIVFACYRLISKARVSSLLSIGKSACSASLSWILGTALNAWWLIPLLLGARNIYHSALSAEHSSIVLEQTSQSTSLHTLLAFIPYNLSSSFWAYKLPGWRLSYATGPFRIIAVTLLTLTLLAVIRKPWYKGTGFLLFLAIAGLFLSLGVNSEFGTVFLWMFRHVPFFQSFRSPTNIFAVIYAFGTSALVAVGLTTVTQIKLIERHVRVRQALVSVAFLAIVGVYAYPMWIGSVADSPVMIRKGTPISSTIALPNSYNTVARFLATQPGTFRVLALPLSLDGYVTFAWHHGYDGPDSLSLLLQHETISHLASSLPGSNLLRTALDQDGKSLAPLVHLAGRMGCRFVVVQGDVRLDAYGGQMSPLASRSRLEGMLSAARATQVLTTPGLSVYRIPSHLVTPMVYATTDVHGVSNVARELQLTPPDRLPVLVKLPGKAAATREGLSQLTRLGTQASIATPHVLSRNPTHWVVRVSSVSSHFLLVLDQSFSTGWHATISWKALSFRDAHKHGVRLGLANHVEANGFANAWYVSIPHEMLGKSLTITLDYGPQNIVPFALRVSYGVLLVIVLLATGKVAVRLAWHVGRRVDLSTIRHRGRRR